MKMLKRRLTSLALAAIFLAVFIAVSGVGRQDCRATPCAVKASPDWLSM